MVRWRQRDCGALARRLLYFHIQRAFVSGRAFLLGRAPKPNEFQRSGNFSPATQLFCVAGIAVASLTRRISCAPLVPVCLRIFRSKSILPHARRRWSFIRSRAGSIGMRGRPQCACRVLRALLRGRQRDRVLAMRHARLPLKTPASCSLPGPAMVPMAFLFAATRAGKVRPTLLKASILSGISLKKRGIASCSI